MSNWFSLKFLDKSYFNKSEKRGLISFYLGIFLLPSAFSIALFFLLISLLTIIYEKIKSNENIFLDSWNKIFIFCSLCLFIISTYKFFDQESINNVMGKGYLEYVGLLNWIPLFFLFLGFQKYLSSSLLRKRFSQLLIAGSMPVFFSVISQLFFNWETKRETLFGLIIWYQKNIAGYTGITGLFNNQNYLGSWLIIIWPFCIAMLFFYKRFELKRLIVIAIIILVSIFTILTTSRAAWICLFIAIPFVNGKKLSNWFLKIVLFGLPIATITYFLIIGERINNILQKIILPGIWSEFTRINLSTRISMWDYAIDLIKKNPFFGSGSASFSSLYYSKSGVWQGHAHNLPLELFVSFGLIVGLMILIPITFLTVKSSLIVFSDLKTNLENTIIDRAWVLSLILLTLMHLVDIQYYDGRISIIAWILLSGAKNIIDEP